MKQILSIVAISALTLAITGCQSSGPTRIKAGGASAVTTMGVDLLDFKDTAGALTQAILTSPALANFTKRENRAPVLRVGKITNKTDMIIDLGQVSGRINEDLLNSGLVEIVSEDSSSVAESDKDAFMNGVAVNQDDRADFYLEGTIMYLAAKESGVKEKTYSFQLRLNNRKRRTVFQRTQDIAKQSSRSTIGW